MSLLLGQRKAFGQESGALGGWLTYVELSMASGPVIVSDLGQQGKELQMTAYPPAGSGLGSNK